MNDRLMLLLEEFRPLQPFNGIHDTLNHNVCQVTDRPVGGISAKLGAVTILLVKTSGAESSSRTTVPVHSESLSVSVSEYREPPLAWPPPESARWEGWNSTLSLHCRRQPQWWQDNQARL